MITDMDLTQFKWCWKVKYRVLCKRMGKYTGLVAGLRSQKQAVDASLTQLRYEVWYMWY